MILLVHTSIGKKISFPRMAGDENAEKNTLGNDLFSQICYLSIAKVYGLVEEKYNNVLIRYLE